MNRQLPEGEEIFLDHVGYFVPDVDAARRVESATHMIANATSLGGVDTTIEGRFRWEGDRVPPGLLRLSVGVEDATDLIDDLEAGLDRAAAVG